MGGFGSNLSPWKLVFLKNLNDGMILWVGEDFAFLDFSQSTPNLAGMTIFPSVGLAIDTDSQPDWVNRSPWGGNT